MPMKPGPDEPVAGPWQVYPLAELVALTGAADLRVGRPVIVAIDGRGAGGKTTLADRVAGAVPGAVVVHTDDIAWNHSRFGWADLVIDGVLDPLHRGSAVHYQPPAWAPNGRTGHVNIPAGTPLVVVEGVGASRREVVDLIDAAVWVQSDFAEAERRGILRDGYDPAAPTEWNEWMAEELPFLTEDRPWERAIVIAAGTPDLAYDPVTEVVLSPPLSASQR